MLSLCGHKELTMRLIKKTLTKHESKVHRYIVAAKTVSLHVPPAINTHHRMQLKNLVIKGCKLQQKHIVIVNTFPKNRNHNQFQTRTQHLYVHGLLHRCTQRMTLKLCNNNGNRRRDTGRKKGEGWKRFFFPQTKKTEEKLL